MCKQSSEEVYEKECGNMPGFATFYRDPNSARVTFEQYIRVWIFTLLNSEDSSCALGDISRDSKNIIFNNLQTIVLPAKATGFADDYL